MNANSPPAKPTQACRRFTYETGQGHPTNTPRVIGSGGVDVQYALEQFALVSQTACWLLQLDIIISPNESTPTNVWVLAWDVVASENARLELVAGNMGAARYSYGPLVPGTSGAMLIREPQEWFQIPTGNGPPDEFAGQPFDNGVLIAISATPRLYSAIDADIMSVVARGRR